MQQNKCVFIRRKSIKQYFSNITSKGITKIFAKLKKSFLTNKDCRKNNNIIVTGDDKMITDEKKLVQIFYDHYNNIGIKLKKVKFDIGSSVKFYFW